MMKHRTRKEKLTHIAQKSNQIFQIQLKHWNAVDKFNQIFVRYNQWHSIQEKNELQKKGKYHCHTVVDTQMNRCDEILCEPI